jgi:hypothetical protein
MIHDLAVIRVKDGKTIFVCPNCKKVPPDAYGAQNKDELVYVWICWQCGGQTLAEWPTLADKEKELREFARHLEPSGADPS